MKDKREEELERIARSYHLNEEIPDKFIEDLCQEHCCEWLSSLISSSDHVVELGYGEGITLSRLSDKAARYTIVEGAPSLVDVVKQKHPKVEVVNSLFEAYTPPQPFDILLALHVFEHVDDPVELGRHLRNWLKDDGEIVVIVPNSTSLHRRLAFLMGLTPKLDTLSQRDHLVGHQRVYDLLTLEDDLRYAGFEPFERRGFFLKTLPNSMMLNHKPELIKALNLLGDQLPVEMTANLAVRARINHK
jgi:2-polyprenyl-3-methyl-5-hydroxy-6-metoxy-1,4-benzoquinol methylase